MKKYNFRVNPEDKELIEWLNNLVIENKLSETVRIVLKFVKDNGLEELQTFDSLKIQKLKADIKYKEFQTKYLELKIKYEYNFDSLPSKQAVHALKENALLQSGYESPEGKKIEEIIDNKWNNFVEELRDRKEDWKISCKLCSVGFLGFKTKENAIERFKKHLEESHERELIEIDSR